MPWASNPEKRFRLSPSAPKVFAGVAYWLGIGPPVRVTEFDSLHPLHTLNLLNAGVAQVEERRSCKAGVGVSSTPSGSKAFGGVVQRQDRWPATSRWGFDSLLFHQIRQGRPSPGCAASDNKCGRGRVVRRRSVEPSTRIQFPPATPNTDGRSSTGQSTGFLNRRFGFKSRRPFQTGPSSNWIGRRSPKPEIPVRVRMGRPGL